jgi:hypothetical protein
VIEGQRRAAIYGQDDRRELFEVDDPELRLLGERSVVAMVAQTALREGPGTIRLEGSTLGERVQLCEGERFREQLSVVKCTGVLIGPDLVLTAGHCLDRLPCAAMRVVQGFWYSGPDALNHLSPESVYRCAEVLATRVDPPTAARQRDYAWIRLDRRGVPAEALALAVHQSMKKGELVTTIGHPSGLPAKTATGLVSEPRDSNGDFFLTALDTFHGNSGSPVFDSGRRLVGILARGEEDYLPTDAGCSAILRRDESPVSAQEEVSYLGPALDGLCDDPRHESACDTVLAGAPGGCALAQRGSGDPTAVVASLLLVVSLALRRETSVLRRNTPTAMGR